MEMIRQAFGSMAAGRVRVAPDNVLEGTTGSARTAVQLDGRDTFISDVDNDIGLTLRLGRGENGAPVVQITNGSGADQVVVTCPLPKAAAADMDTPVDQSPPLSTQAYAVRIRPYDTTHSGFKLEALQNSGSYVTYYCDADPAWG